MTDFANRGGKRRKIAVILVDRANYGRMKPVMKAIQQHDRLEIQVICAGTMVLERFGFPIEIVKQDGFMVDSEVYIELEGSTPATMAKSLGFAVIEFASEFQRLKPELVLLIGDRYEALAAAMAASYMNICLAHIQGGEVSGSIDESARHCISKLSQFHFPSTERSAEFLVRMGERRDTVFAVGCPSGDIALAINRDIEAALLNSVGSGANLDISVPYLLVVFHPVTTEFGLESSEVSVVLEALDEFQIQTIWLWPNIDAGSDHVSKMIRVFREKRNPNWLRLIKNLSPENYLKILGGAACAVGNSSSFVRDSSFFGTPVVLLGERQRGREIAENVVRVEKFSKEELASAIRRQLSHGSYQPSTLYGDGHAAKRIAQKLSEITPYIQKHLSYIDE